MRRSDVVGAVLFALGLAVVGMVGVWIFIQPARNVPPASVLSASSSATSAIGGPFQLVDHEGGTVSHETLKGRPFLVFFGFTHCPEICPTKLWEMSEILRAMGDDGDRVSALFITVDPERDTREVLARYLSSFHPSIRGLTGTPDEIAAAVKAYRAFARKVPLEGGDYTVDHTAVVYLMDREGRFLAPLNVERPPEEVAEQLRARL